MNIFKKITAVIISASALITCTVPIVSAAEVNAMNGDVLSEETVNFYAYWKEKYLAQDPYVTLCAAMSMQMENSPLPM